MVKPRDCSNVLLDKEVVPPPEPALSFEIRSSEVHARRSSRICNETYTSILALKSNPSRGKFAPRRFVSRDQDHGDHFLDTGADDFDLLEEARDRRYPE